MNISEQEIRDRKKTASKLYIAAWVIEVFSVLIGLGIALMTMFYSFGSLYEGKQGSLGVGDFTNIFIATVPFIMVAIVELTKIPFTEAVYKTQSYLWKILFLVSLTFIAFITFESAMNGFERNFQALVSSVDKPSKQLVTVEETLENLNNEYEKLSNLTQEGIDQRFNEQYKELSVQKNEQVNRLNDQIKDIRARSETSYIKAKRAENSDLEREINALRTQRDRETERVVQEFQENLKVSQQDMNVKRRNLQNQFHVEMAKLRDIEKQAQETIENANFFNESRVRSEQRELINEQEKKVEQLRAQLNSIDASGVLSENQRELNKAKDDTSASYDTKISDLREKIAKNNQDISRSLSSKEKDNEVLISGISQEINRLENAFLKQVETLKAQRDNDYDRLENFSQKKQELDERMTSLNEQRVTLREEINLKVADSQIYRMAQWWWDKENAADVSKENVATVALIWFGSLALLIAITGIVLAFASLVVGDIKRIERSEHKRYDSAFNRLLGSIRKYFVNQSLKKRIKYVEVDKVEYVEVDKVVFKEVPVEVVKKEIVYMPFYTNDKELLNLSSMDLNDKPSSEKDGGTDGKSK